MWRGRNICAHTVAVAESLNSHQQFIDVLHKSKPECNLTKLVTTSCERRKAGTKSGAHRKRGGVVCKVPVTTFRSRLDDVCPSDHDTSAETGVTAAATNSYGQRSSMTASESSIGGDVSVGCTSQTFYSVLHSTEVTINVFLHRHGMDQGSFIPLAHTEYKRCLGTVTVHMDPTFSHHHKCCHLHMMNQLHFL